jgi:hypothetical protein
MHAQMSLILFITFNYTNICKNNIIWRFVYFFNKPIEEESQHYLLICIVFFAFDVVFISCFQPHHYNKYILLKINKRLRFWKQKQINIFYIVNVWCFSYIKNQGYTMTENIYLQ